MTGASPVAPEAQQHDLAAVVRQTPGLAVQIGAGGRRCCGAHLQMRAFKLQRLAPPQDPLLKLRFGYRLQLGQARLQRE